MAGRKRLFLYNADIPVDLNSSVVTLADFLTRF